MDNDKAKSILECLLFVTNRPLPAPEIADIIGLEPDDIPPLLAQIKQDLEARKSAMRIAEIAEGYQMATNEGYGYWVKKLFREQLTFRLSPSAMETLSIVAYKQPITRAEIEEIRGVEVTGVLETLMERKLVKIAGRKESVGRPLLYATTAEFLRHFNLWRISELPSLEDLTRELERRQAEAAGTVNSETLPETAEIKESGVADPIKTEIENPEVREMNPNPPLENNAQSDAISELKDPARPFESNEN